MFWFSLAMLVFLPVSLVFLWRSARDQPHPRLMRRMWLGVTAGLWVAELHRVFSWEPLQWFTIPASFAFFGYGFVHATRLIRIQNREALERWRAKGSPPPLRDPGERQ